MTVPSNLARAAPAKIDPVVPCPPGSRTRAHPHRRAASRTWKRTTARLQEPVRPARHRRSRARPGLARAGGVVPPRWDGGVGARDQDASCATACATAFGGRSRSGREQGNHAHECASGPAEPPPPFFALCETVYPPQLRLQGTYSPLWGGVPASRGDRPGRGPRPRDGGREAAGAPPGLPGACPGRPAGDPHQGAPGQGARPISERCPLAADRDHRLAGGDHREVAGVADAGGDGVGDVIVARRRDRGVGSTPIDGPAGLGAPGRRPPSRRPGRRRPGPPRPRRSRGRPPRRPRSSSGSPSPAPITEIWTRRRLACQPGPSACSPSAPAPRPCAGAR